MSLDELYSLCPIELDSILSQYHKEERLQKEWERLQTFILFNAQGGSESIKTPKDLITLPWDDELDESIVIPTDIDWDELDRKYKEGKVI